LVDMLNMKTLAMNSIQPKEKASTGAVDLSQQFGSFLNDAMTNLSTQETSVDQLNQRFISGDLPDVHQLMIASESATLGLELTVQVRNKVIEAYQEIMRMQM
jgi:flagellar hook-basal body complex protein FliE